jgi:hypothetical protein
MNEALYDFFNTHYGRGRVALVGETNLIGKAIREAQRKVRPDEEASLWSHVFILGDRRPRTDSGKKEIYLFESDINPLKPMERNGAQESWIGKWCNEEVGHAAILDFKLTEAEQDAVLGTALQLCDEQVRYNVTGLVSTWLAIVTKRTWDETPSKSPHALYCSSFVRYCYRKAGRDFLGTEVALSHTSPEHVSLAAPPLAKWEKRARA